MSATNCRGQKSIVSVVSYHSPHSIMTTCWQLPRLWGSNRDTCVMELGLIASSSWLWDHKIFCFYWRTPRWSIAEVLPPGVYNTTGWSVAVLMTWCQTSLSLVSFLQATTTKWCHLVCTTPVCSVAGLTTWCQTSLSLVFSSKPQPQSAPTWCVQHSRAEHCRTDDLMPNAPTCISCFRS